ncbi:MAG: biopolymer transporter ExbD [bacterium]
MAGGFANGSSFDGENPVAEINITPLTDVMLVLLIIAMVVAPTLTFKGASLNLPKVNQAMEFKEDQNLLEILPNGQYVFNQEAVTPELLALGLTTLVKDKEAADSITLIIAAAPTTSVENLTTVWNLATGIGVEKIVLAGDVVDQGGKSLLHRDAAPETTVPSSAPETPATTTPPATEPGP